MKVFELEEKLNKLGIPKDTYSILKGGLPNERLCIVKEEKWCVYYSEKGRKSGLKKFQTETEACEYFSLSIGNISTPFFPYSIAF